MKPLLVTCLLLAGCSMTKDSASLHQTTVEVKSPSVLDALLPNLTDQDIETVKGGVLANYDSTTVGKAFNGTFQNAKWSKLETPKGQTVVQFDGTTTEKAVHPEWGVIVSADEVQKAGCGTVQGTQLTNEIIQCMKALPVPVKFQFLLSADKKTFTLSYSDPFFKGADKALAFVYQ